MNAQVLYSDNFDAFTSGAKVAQTIGTAFWTTWSTAPGGAEDAVFSNTQSLSPSNSIYVSGANDLIFKAGAKTTGRYELSWKMFVPTNNIGYFNLLQTFSGNTSVYGFQAYIYNDSIIIDAGGASAASAQFSKNTWHAVKMIVDVDDDFATLYVDANEVVSYKWSSGTDGAGSIHKLDAIDFYAWDGTGSPTTITNGSTVGYYVDDINYEQVVAPESPSNLTAVLNGLNVDVAWTAPTVAPDSYKLSRNGIVVYTTPSNVTYTDNGPWPNNYDYVVRAHTINSGYSHSSNSVSVLVPGGVTRNLVLMEEGTSISCTYCPYAAMGIRDLIDVNNKDAVGVAYHPNSLWGSFADAYTNASSVARMLYYNITGLPSVAVDGNLKFEGVYGSVTQYPYYLTVYNERIALPSFHNINVSIVPTTTDNYTATITVDQSYEAWTSGIKLHTVLTESNIPQAWLGQTELDCVARGMFPDENGTDLDFSTINTQTVVLNFSTAGFVKNNCEFVAFIQHDASKEVTQVVKVDMSSILGIKELNGERISIYPNPAFEYLMLNSTGKGTMTISDITGKIVYSSVINNTTQYTDISKFAKGVYVVKVTSNENTFTQKLVIE